MAKSRAIVESPDEDIQATRQVKVRKVTNEEYIREEPAVDVEVESSPPDPFDDPFGAFNEIVTASQDARLRIWLLPNYDKDGRIGVAGTEREYCGSVNYDPEDASSVLDQIRPLVPFGGTIQLELYADGHIQKRGLLKLVKVQPAPGTISNPNNYPHLVINQPAQQQQAPMNPAEIMREHMSLAKDLVSMARDLVPPAPTINVGENGASGGGANLQDRLLETVLVKALESDKAPIDRVLEVLGGPRETSWTDSLMTAIGPAVPEILRTIGPGLNALMLRFATGGQQASPAPVQATTTGVQEPAPGQPQLASEQPATPAPPQISPVERAYIKTLMRLLEDCMEHAEVSAISADRISVTPAAESIVELVDRFPEQLTGTVAALLEAPALSVFDMCAGVITPHAAQILALKEKPGAVEWIEELQVACKEILSEQDEAASEKVSQSQ